MTSGTDWAVCDMRPLEDRLDTHPFELELNCATVASEAAKANGRGEWILPGIWITPPAFNEDGEIEGRTYIEFYEADYPDPGGLDALAWGSCYYREAMEHMGRENRDARVECFQAAEILYLHAAKRGNIQAFANLGYIYSYNRCEDHYWEQTVLWMSEYDFDKAAEARASYQREKRAFECFLKAAEHDCAEACYKVGDLFRKGEGCERDCAAAYAWYEKAYGIGKDDDPAIWGSAALRLARSHENGQGCRQSFEEALYWYRIAEAGLAAAVNAGDWYYEKSLDAARRGAKRMPQEIDGGY